MDYSRDIAVVRFQACVHSPLVFHSQVARLLVTAFDGQNILSFLFSKSDLTDLAFRSSASSSAPHYLPFNLKRFLVGVQLVNRDIAILTVPGGGGQKFHFPHFSSTFHHCFLFFLKLSTFFCPHFGPPGGRVAHPGRPWLRHWS